MPLIGVAIEKEGQVAKPQPPKPVSLVRGKDGFIAFPLVEYEEYQKQLEAYICSLEGKPND
jgi:hypothetical protein